MSSLVLLGTGCPSPSDLRFGPSTLFTHDNKNYLFDCGSGVTQRLSAAGVRSSEVDVVFVTHMHSDHIDGLGELSLFHWVGGQKKKPLKVYGPPGINHVVEGFNMAYSQDSVYRNLHHGEDVASIPGFGMIPVPFDFSGEKQSTEVFNENGVKVDAFLVDHAPASPAVGYKISYKGRSAVISGDTSKNKNLEMQAANVDLLIHSGLSPKLLKMMRDAAERVGNNAQAKIFHDVLDYHTYPYQAAEIARDAKVKHLLFYHIVPPLDAPGLKTLWIADAKRIFKNYTIGEDGTLISLPANSNKIEIIRDSL